MTNEERVRAYWDRVWSRGDAAYAHEFYAPTFRLNAEEIDAAEWAAGAAEWRGKFENFSANVEHLFAFDGGVVTQVTYRARHTGDLRRVPATGREIEITGLDVFLFEDGRCVEHLHEADHHTMFLQLGAPPAPDGS